MQGQDNYLPVAEPFTPLLYMIIFSSTILFLSMLKFSA